MLSVSRANIEYQADSLRQIWEDESTIDTVRYNALENYFDLYNRVQPDSALMALDYYYALAKEKKHGDNCVVSLWLKQIFTVTKAI